ncbi:MAG: discoidin domain-containing protein [Planctomycetes bacterium]|nr:discoidin domain-containing protein [Planctomycetota bacterium]
MHRLTICVDNRMIHDIGVYGHSYGPETQSRWNGVVGGIELVADSGPLRRLEAHPAADARSVTAVVDLRSREALPRTLPLELVVSTAGGQVLGAWRERVVMAPGTTVLERRVELAAAAARWDEFSPTLHRLTASLDGGPPRTVSFGFRHIERDGRAIRVNGRPVFLRGTLDCCVYPRTGHPPTGEREWLRILGVVKQHGFNHVRFHSWCPPEAAFAAADQLGLYLQPETAWWVDNWIAATGGGPSLPGADRAVEEFIAAEIRRISEAYGNHPSFALFCIGNEFGADSDWDALDRLIAAAKRRDPRRLYNASTARERVASDDFWVTHRAGAAAARGIGPAHSDWDFAAAVAAAPLPLIAHETGQRPVFPDFPALIPKFDGPLKPLNLERLARKLDDSGLADQLGGFVTASARFQAALYQSEHEAMSRTPGFGGYQLLMLNDFTGQSQAHVGFLDPFLESKGVFGPEELRRWNAPTVPLARFERYTWSTAEAFRAELQVAHYGPAALERAAAEWSLRTVDGGLVGQGWLLPREVPTGGVTALGSIEVPLGGLADAALLELRLCVGEAQNHWRLLAAPPAAPPSVGESDLLVTELYDATARRVLAEGGRILLLAHGHRDVDTTTSRFQPVYWSGGWWGDRFSHLGGLCDPDDPALAGFPTDGSADWTWHELMEGGALFDLSWTPAGLRPLIQAVPDFHHDARLGWVWQARVGPGRLLVSGFDLATDLDRRHAARALRDSLVRYAAGPRFQPRFALEPALLEQRLAPSRMQELGAEVLSVSAEAPGYEARHLLDGDPRTLWHTPWTGQPPDFPHEVVLDLGREVLLRGLRFHQRGDGPRGGKLSRLRVAFALQPGVWLAGEVEIELDEAAGAQDRLLDVEVGARYLRLTALGSHEGEAWGSLGECEILTAE